MHSTAVVRTVGNATIFGLWGPRTVTKAAIECMWHCDKAFCFLLVLPVHYCCFYGVSFLGCCTPKGTGQNFAREACLLQETLPSSSKGAMDWSLLLGQVSAVGPEKSSTDCVA